MLDWSKLFNIVFVAAALALIVFFLVSTIVVAVKGKRKCNAFDVILRIVATLAFIAATAMFACSVLTMLSGDFRIAFTLGADGALAPVFVFNGSATELPLADLFIALATTVGSELAAALFICSLVALIVDCLVANKKAEKKSKAKAPAKTPEQVKRDAELERIRRIGESAVQKTNAAANAKSVENAETATRSESVNETSETAESDWRSEQPEKPTEFVGLNTDVTDDSFDSFDDDPDGAETNADDGAGEDGFDAEQESIKQDDGQADESEFDSESEEETTEEYTNDGENADDDLDAFIDEFFAEDDKTDSVESEELSDGETDNGYSDSEQEQERQEEYAEEQEQPDDEAWYAQGNEGEYVDDETLDDDVAETEDPEMRGLDENDDEHIEPNRDIYIPQMRTVVKDTSDVDDIASVTEAEASDKSVAASDKTRAKSSSAGSDGAKRTTKSSGKRSAQSAAKGKKSKSATNIPAEKKLPVTRRYVILDRRNAVNMFGEYLKDRNQTEKDKLKSSINTIIIE